MSARARAFLHGEVVEGGEEGEDVREEVGGEPLHVRLRLLLRRGHHRRVSVHSFPLSRARLLPELALFRSSLAGRAEKGQGLY